MIRRYIAIIFALCATLADGQSIKLLLTQSTSTQIVAKYYATGRQACTVDSYQDSAHLIRDQDTDPSIFTNANSDLLRYPLEQSGFYRQFVIGTIPGFNRDGNVTGLDGNYYSRALAVESTHYVHLACLDGGTLDFQASTKTRPTWNMMPVAMPQAPTDGAYAFQTIDYGNRNKLYVDQETGLPFKVMVLPRDDTNDLTNKTPSAVVGPCTSWSTTGGLLVTGATTTYTAGANDVCGVHLNITGSSGDAHTYALGQVSVSLTASSASSSSLLTAISLDDCSTFYSPWQTVPLTATSTTYHFPFNGTSQTAASVNDINTWTTNATLLPYSLVYNLSTFSICFKTSATDLNAGNVKLNLYRGYNSTGWTIGNQFCCSFTTVLDDLGTKRWLIADPAKSGETGKYYSLDPAGFDLEYLGKIVVPTTTGLKTSAGDGLIVLSNSAIFDHTDPTATWDIGALCADSAGSGSCSKNIVASPNGASESANEITITTTAAHSAIIGSQAVISSVGVSGYNITCTIDSVTTTTFTCPDPTSGLAASGGGSVQLTTGHTVYKLSMPASGSSYYRTGVASGASITVSSVTLNESASNTLENKLAAFDARYDPTKFTSIHLDCIQNDNIIGSTLRGVQNTYGLAWVYNLTTKSVIAVRASWAGPWPWEALHNYECIDDSAPGYAWVSHHGLTGCVPNSVGCGPYTTTLQSTLNGTDAPGTLQTITVAGDPTSPFADSPLQTFQAGNEIMEIGSNACTVADKCEQVQVVSNNGGNSLTVSRGFGVGTNVSVAVKSHAIGDAISMTGSTGWWLKTTTTAREVLWDFAHDPHGLDTTCTLICPDSSVQAGGHQAASGGPLGFVRVSDAGGPNGDYSACNTTTMSSQVSDAGCPTLFNVGVQGSTFANVSSQSGAADYQKHPTSPHAVALSSTANFLAEDVSAYQGAGAVTGALHLNSITLVSGQLWKVVPVKFNPRFWPQFATAGSFPLKDLSGPGAVIDGTSTYSYKYCVALFANDCGQTGSAPNDIFVNAPFTGTPTSCAATSSPPVSLLAINMICFADHTTAAEATSEFAIDKNDPLGARTRILSGNNTPFLLQSFGASAMVTSDGKFVLAPMWSREMQASTIVIKRPSWSEDVVNGSEFIQRPMGLGKWVGATHSILEFSYYPDLSGCMSRNEGCVNDTSTYSQATPWHWKSETYTGVNCSVNCYILGTFLKDKVVYLRKDYRDASNNVLNPNEVVDVEVN